MSADEIRKLAESGVLDSACCFDIDKDCVNACDPDEISECRQKRDIRAALLAYAAMVERCEKLKAQCVKICGKNDCDNKGSKCIQCAYSVIDFIEKGASYDERAN